MAGLNHAAVIAAASLLTEANLADFTFTEDKKPARPRSPVSISSCSSGQSIIQRFAARTQRRAMREKRRREKRETREEEKKRSKRSEEADGGSDGLSGSDSSSLSSGEDVSSEDSEFAARRNNSARSRKVSALPITDVAIAAGAITVSVTGASKSIVESSSSAAIPDLFPAIKSRELWRHGDDISTIGVDGADDGDDDDDDGNPFAENGKQAKKKKTEEPGSEDDDADGNGAYLPPPSAVASVASLILPDVIVFDAEADAPLLDIGSVLCVAVPAEDESDARKGNGSSAAATGNRIEDEFSVDAVQRNEEDRQPTKTMNKKNRTTFVAIGIVAAQLGNINRCSYVVKTDHVSAVVAKQRQSMASQPLQQQRGRQSSLFLAVGSPCFVQRSKMVLLDGLARIIEESKLKATDASYQDDMELASDQEGDFSDDEKERAFRAEKKEKKRMRKMVALMGADGVAAAAASGVDTRNARVHQRQQTALYQQQQQQQYNPHYSLQHQQHKQQQYVLQQQLEDSDGDDSGDDDEVEYEFDAEGAIIAERRVSKQHALVLPAGTRRQAAPPLMPTPTSSSASAATTATTAAPQRKRYVPPETTKKAE